MEGRLDYTFSMDSERPGQEEFYYITQSIDNGLAHAPALKFDVPPHDTDYTDGSEMYLKLVFMVMDSKGETLKSDDKVFLCNGAFGNFFSDCNVELNHHRLPAVTEVPYTSFLVNTLGTTKRYRDDLLDTISHTTTPSEGAPKITASSPKTNLINISQSREVTMYGKIPSDFLGSCGEPIPNNVRITISLQRNHENFILGHDDATKEYKIKLLKCTLFVKRIRMNTAAQNVLDGSIARGGFLKYRRLSTMMQPVHKGSLSHGWFNVFHGRVPSRIFFGLVKQLSHVGALNYYPMFFDTAGVSDVAFLVNGRHVMVESYKPTFRYIGDTATWNTSDITGPLLGLYQALGGFKNQDLGIGPREWINGMAIYATKLPHYDSSMATKMGSFDIQLAFSKPLSENYVLIAMGEFDHALEFEGPERKFSTVDLT